MRLFVFHTILIPLGKAWIQLFSLHSPVSWGCRILYLCRRVRSPDPQWVSWLLKTKNSDYNTWHTETLLLHPSFLHSQINQYGRLFTSGPSKTFTFLESIRGGHLHGLTLILKNLMVKLQLWSFGECGVPIHCHCSQVHSDPEWWHLKESYLWVK